MGCEKCNGTGKIGRNVPADPRVFDVGNGFTMQDMGGYETHACECGADLPPVDGKATWWGLGGIYSKTIGVPVGDESIEVAVRTEVPRREDGRRVHRTQENFYYPTMIDFECSCDKLTLFSETARELAAALIEAADVCDKADAVGGKGKPNLTTENAEDAE